MQHNFGGPGACHGKPKPTTPSALEPCAGVLPWAPSCWAGGSPGRGIVGSGARAGRPGSGSAFGPFQLGDRSTRRTTAVCRIMIEFFIRRRVCSAEAGHGSQPTPETKSTAPAIRTATLSGSSLNVGSVVMSVNLTSKWTSELWQLAGRRGGRPLREREERWLGPTGVTKGNGSGPCVFRSGRHKGLSLSPPSARGGTKA